MPQLSREILEAGHVVRDALLDGDQVEQLRNVTACGCNGGAVWQIVYVVSR
jgi:hypothetical protein